MNEQTRKFILENENADILQLALHTNKNSDLDIQFAIRQIQGRQKIKKKVPLFYNNLELKYPLQLSLEQSSSEPTAEYKSSLCDGSSLVDLTGGFGVDCYFLSSNFKHITYVERNYELCELAKHNFVELGRKNIEVINEISENYIQKIIKVDWIYIDPARRSSAGKKVVLLSDCEPDVSTLASTLLNKATNLMIKLSPMIDISAALKDLTQTKEVHIIAVENECKEILLILNSEKIDSIKLTTVNILKNNYQQIFESELESESSSVALYNSNLCKYIYEPNAAVMKSGAFKTISDRFEIFKLHINTHLYTSDKLILEFPGRIFEVIKIWDNSKYSLKTIVNTIPKANITTRNYPLSVDKLRKKLKIKDGGNTYIFACTISNDEKTLIECKKVEQ